MFKLTFRNHLLFCTALLAATSNLGAGPIEYEISAELQSRDSFASGTFDGLALEARVNLPNSFPDLVRAPDVVFRDLGGSLTLGGEELEVRSVEARFRTSRHPASDPGGYLRFTTSVGEIRISFDSNLPVPYDPTYDPTISVPLPTDNLRLTNVYIWELPNIMCFAAPCPGGPMYDYLPTNSSMVSVPEPDGFGLMLAMLLIMLPLRRRFFTSRVHALNAPLP